MLFGERKRQGEKAHLKLSYVGREPGVLKLVLIRETGSDVVGKRLVASHELDVGSEGRSGGGGVGLKSRRRRVRERREAFEKAKEKERTA